MQDNDNQSTDVSGTLAALLAVSGQKPLSAQVCDGDSRCRIRDTVFSLRASCSTQELDPSDFDLDMPGEHSMCSTINPDVCVSVTNRGYREPSYANFASGLPSPCPDQVDGSCPGAWCTIFGAMLPHRGVIDPMFSTVDCEAEFGTAQLVQTGGGTPDFLSGTFIRSNNLVSDESDMVNWNRIYTVHHRSPYTFAASIFEDESGNRTDNLFRSLAGYTLLANQPWNKGSYAREQIEYAFEMATMMAWARSPPGSNHTITRDV
jgi:hypothetical protein